MQENKDLNKDEALSKSLGTVATYPNDSVLTISNSDMIKNTTTAFGYDSGSSEGDYSATVRIKKEPTNYQMCAEINGLAGNLIDPSLDIMAAQKKIIECEWNEMCASVESGNFEQLRDDVQDMLFTVYGMAARMGFPADLDFKAVCDSQYSKFDSSEIDAMMTRNKYLALGVETYYETKSGKDNTNFYVTYSAKDQTGTDNKFYPAGKWLKSVYFKDPIFSPITGA